MIGRGAFQETDIIGVTLPIVKHSYLITDINDIPRIVKEAFYIAQSGRPGPVVIDFPKNIQQAKDPAGLADAGGNQKRPARLHPARFEGRRHRAERNHRPDRKGRAPGDLLRRRHHHQRRGGGIEEIRRGHEHSRDHHAHGHRRFSGNASALAALAGHARRGLRQLGRQRRIRASQDPSTTRW